MTRQFEDEGSVDVTAVPFPDHEIVTPSDAAEVEVIAGAVAGAVAPPGGLTSLQRTVLNSMCESLLGVVVDLATVVQVGPEDFARAMRDRGRDLRTRIVHAMLVGELLLVPLPDEIATRVAVYAACLGVQDDIIDVARSIARGSFGLLMFDFERCGYFEHLRQRPARYAEDAGEADGLWERVWDDARLYAQWASLGACPEGSLGLEVWRFYMARGFTFPGKPESAPPTLAQHDWVPVLARYGSSIESEIEVFALIARANHDPGAFSLLAMVLSLFETGSIEEAAGGFFRSERGHLSHDADRMGIRLGDAMARGKAVGGHLDSHDRQDDSDLLAVDWFGRADRPVDDVRAEFGLPTKSGRAISAGSVTPWDPGGISNYQYRRGQQRALADGRIYNSFGALPAG